MRSSNNGNHNRRIAAKQSKFKVYIKIVSNGILVRLEPMKSSVVICSLQTGQIHQLLGDTIIDDTHWFMLPGGWICSRDSTGFLCSEPANETEANAFWAREFSDCKRISTAVSSLLVRSHALPNARRSSNALVNLARTFVSEQRALLNLPGSFFLASYSTSTQVLY